MKRLPLALLALVLSVLAVPTLTPPAAHGFGTINGFGQSAEHERITRAALACKGTSSSSCFEPVSTDNLAGARGTFGAVGSPDSDEIFTEAAHCDGADFLATATYPQSRATATAKLAECVAHLKRRFDQAVDAANGLLDDKGRLIAKEVDLKSSCTFTGGVSGRAKCDVLEGLGRTLHGAEDFYSHSNWTDTTVGTVGVGNPPGLGLTSLPPFLNLRSGVVTGVPTELATGCFSLVPFGCRKRITHGVLNKDEGTIDPATGATSAPTTDRGKVGGNFNAAVAGAVREARRQWSDLSAALVGRYGATRGNLMICALTRDDPMKDCTGRMIMIVVDSSGSNTETDPSNLRIAAGQALNESLVSQAEAGPEERPDESGVVDFDTSARLVSPLADPSLASFAGIDSSGGTDIGAGVSLAIGELTKDPARPVQDRAGVVVLTDGLDGGTSLPGALAQAAALGIRVNFGFLSPPEVPLASGQSPAARADLGKAVPRRAFTPDTELVSAITATGGIYSVITNAEAQQEFVGLVGDNGLANLDDPNGTGPGGLVRPGVSSTGVLPADGKATHEFTSRPGRTVSFALRSLDGRPISATASDIVTGKDLGTVTTSVTDVATLPVRATSGQVSLRLSAAGGGLYELGVSQTGVDLLGTAAGDSLVCTGSPTYVDAGSGNDTVTCGVASDTVVGGPGRDMIATGDGDDLVIVPQGDLAKGKQVVDGGTGADTVVLLLPRPDSVRCKAGTTRRVRIGRSVLKLRGVEQVLFGYAPCASAVAQVEVGSLQSRSGSAKQPLKPPAPRLLSARLTNEQVVLRVKVKRATGIAAAATVRFGGRTYATEQGTAQPRRGGKVKVRLALPDKAVARLTRRAHGTIKVYVATAGVGGGRTRRDRGTFAF